MSHIECPLCSSNQVEELEMISGESLRKLYSTIVDVNGLSTDLWTDCTYTLCKACDLRYFSPAVCGDEKFYNALQTFPWYYQDEKNEFQMAAAHLKPGMKVLDVGAGKGVFKQYAIGCEYIGLEFSEEAQKYAMDRGVVIERKSIEKFAIDAPQSIDAICSFQVLEHVFQPGAFMRACVQTLKPGGLLIISVPAYDGFTGMAINSTLNLPPHHVSHWSDKSLETVATLFNLKLVSLETEPTQSIHAFSANHARMNIKLRNMFGLPVRCIDFSIMGKLVAKLAVLAVRMGLRAKENDLGHSIIAVYEKKS